MDAFNNVRLGFVGLGAMGAPMAGHLADKLPSSAKIFVFDVVSSVVEQICSKYPGRVIKGTDAKNVAEQSVCLLN